MWKVLVASVLGLGIGVVGGLSYMNQALAPRLAQAEAETARLHRQLDELKSESDAKLARAEKLNAELASRTEEVNELYAEIGDLRENAASLDAGLEEKESEEEEAQSRVEEDSEAARATEEEGDRRRLRGTEGEAARREMAERFRQGMFDFLDTEYQQAADPETQQRILQLSEETNALMNLRQQMREAQTEEERDRLREEHKQHLQEVDRLMQAQQGQLLRDVAQQFNIKGPQRQEFVRAMRQTLESPYFSPFMMYRRWQDREGRGQQSPGR